MKAVSLFLIGVFTLAPFFRPGWVAAAEPRAVEKEFSKALQGEIRTQENVDAWEKEKQELVQEILNLKIRQRWLRYQNKEYASYIEQKKSDLATLSKRKEELRILRMKLAPYLDETVKRLKSVVAADLPFLPKERQDRLQFLEQSLSEYGVDLSERLRRVLKGLEVEAGYGDGVEVTSRELSIRGKKTLVRVLRLGRIALFYVTGDGTLVGKWDRECACWQPLPREYGQVIGKTMDIVQQQRAVEFVDLPLPEDRQETVKQ